MGIDYYAYEVCGDAFPDVIDYGHCGSCEEVLCGDCRDKMGEKYGVLGEDHEQADDFGGEAPLQCDSCYKPERIKLKSKYELQKEATEKVKEIIKIMNGLSEEGFLQKYHNDPAFNKGFDVLVQVMQAKFDA